MSMSFYEIYKSIEDYMYVKTKHGYIRLPLTTKEVTNPSTYSVDMFNFPTIKITSELQGPSATAFIEELPEIVVDDLVRNRCYFDYSKAAICRNKDILASKIKKVIFNDPATIVLWRDGTKTVVKCQDDDAYDKMTGLAMCISKKFLGNSGRYYNVFKKYIDEVDV